MPHNVDMQAFSAPPLTWDIFCHVIDNWGDMGVCWRLANNLASRGHKARLWADDLRPLAWMAPGATEGAFTGIEVREWPRADVTAAPPGISPGDVLIEAFGCEISPAWVEALHPASPADQAQRVWLNLEYLSAEPYVERCHQLASPVMSGPLAGRTKWFFYPGLTPATGGLLREPDLLAQQERFDRDAWLAQQNIVIPSDALQITLFCYEPPALSELLQQPALQYAHWLVAPGRAQAAMDSCWGGNLTAKRLALPHLPQTEFDHLLWASDLNLVRGEDSLVRALWAGQPFVWQIYPQDDDAHHLKLEAFLDWLQAPESLRAFHRVWNGVVNAPLPPPDLPLWRECIQAARERLLAQDDLATQLFHFVMEKR